MTRFLAGLIAIAVLIAALGFAHRVNAFGLGAEGKRFGRLGSTGAVTVFVPQPTGKILLVDAVSHLLQVDGVSRICRAGGC